MKQGPKNLKRILTKSRHLQALIKTGQEQHQILNTIKKLLDNQLAIHCISANFSNGQLTLFADSSVWASRFRFDSRNLVQKCRDNGIEVARLDVRVIPAAGKPPQKKQRVPLKISSHTSETLKQTASSLDDEALEAALRRLARHTGD